MPGSSVDIDVRVDAPATQTIGAAFRIMQTIPASPSSFFQITARDFTASVYNDTTSGTPDAQVLALPSALLSPANGDNLGRNTIGLAGAAAGLNLFVEKFTLSVNPATPLGSYRIQPTPGGHVEGHRHGAQRLRHERGAIRHRRRTAAYHEPVRSRER